MVGEWVWDGGRPCLDLINTVRDRKTDPRELLTGPGELAGWLGAAKLLAAPVVPTDKHLAAVRALREAADRLLQDVPQPSDAELVNRHAAMRAPDRRLAIDDRGRLHVTATAPDDPVTVALGAIARDLIELLSEQARIKICASADCGLRFEDRSPAGNRQWCSMSRCGNREKARQHYRRRPR